MGAYVIVNPNGYYIRKDEASGKYVPIKSFKHATRWSDVDKANGVLNNCISKSIRSSYAVQFIVTEQNVDKEDMSIQNEICFGNIEEDDGIKDWMSKINVIIDVINGSDLRQNELNEKLSDVDKKIVDVEHYIEFGKFNAYQGWLCFKMLQNLLQQRRKYKNEILIINSIKQCNFDESSLHMFVDTINNIKNKCYRPRAIPELFGGK